MTEPSVLSGCSSSPRISPVRSWLGFTLCLLIFQGVLAEAAFGAWHSDEQAIMGTSVSAEIWHDDSAEAAELLAAVMAEMRRIEAAYSPYIDTSELSKLNRRAAERPVKVSGEMWRLLQASQRVSELSNGAFDITYASAGRLYDYRDGDRPADRELAAAVAAIDYRHVQLSSGRHVRFTHPDVYIDLGGIAKGYAVDQAVALLRAQGISDGIVAAGGDSRILGDRKGRPWTVGVQNPRDRGEMIALLPLIDTAVSTSGDYERYFEENGVRYHHIINPGNGDSARELRSVTILGPQGLFTDALSTAVFVLGLDKGLALIDGLPGVDAVIVDGEGELLYSAELDPLR